MCFDELSNIDFDFIYEAANANESVSWSLIDKFLETPSCCKEPYMQYDSGISTCINCGLVDCSDREISIPVQLEYEMSTKQCYLRKSYFKEKLRLLACINFSMSPNYKPLLHKLNNLKAINRIKNHIRGKIKKDIIQFFIDINLVDVLRNILKKIHAVKFYKHIYNIIFDIFDIKVFNINERLIDSLTYEWIIFETNFRRLFPSKHNMINYNVILYNLFRRNKIRNYKMLVLPLNKKNIQKIIQSNLLIDLNFTK